MRIVAISAALLAVMLAGPASAEIPAKPKPPTAAAKQKDARKPKDVKPSPAQLAHDGDAQAQFQVGRALYAGKGVKRDPEAAIMWFGLAAANGIPAAAVEIAKVHEQGKRMPEAARWWYLAGTMGDLSARARFLDLFVSGEAGSVGGEAALSWLQPRVAEGDIKAIMALGVLFEDRDAPTYDPAKAEAWYLKAALDGHAEAQYRLGQMLLTRAGAWRLLYKDVEREKNNPEHNRLYAGLAEATAIAGDDRNVDPMRPGLLPGRYWLTEAARQGHAEAQYLLGMTLLAGIDLPFDLDEALTWLEAASEQNHAGALIVIAGLAAKGQGFNGKDPIRAWVSYDLAAQLGRKDAIGARDDVAKTMSGRQINRARQIAQDLREIRGM